MVYASVDQLDFTLGDVPAIPTPRRVLMTTPDHFEVAYVINPHMAGHIGAVNTVEAHKQWQTLKTAYAETGTMVATVSGAAGWPDMVFCANQTLPAMRPDGRKVTVLSRMFAKERQGEVPTYEAFFSEAGYTPLALPKDTGQSFEGMGDALWHPNRFLLWGGHGFRTDLVVYDFIAEHLDVRVLALHLDDPDFYHLDTCLCLLNETTALIYPGAFAPEGLALIHHMFETVLEAPEDEARALFACNAHSPDGHHVLIQKGCTATNATLKTAGFTPVEIETGEFLKSGGSVFCMKMMFW